MLCLLMTATISACRAAAALDKIVSYPPVSQLSFLPVPLSFPRTGRARTASLLCNLVCVYVVRVMTG